MLRVTKVCTGPVQLSSAMALLGAAGAAGLRSRPAKELHGQPAAPGRKACGGEACPVLGLLILEKEPFLLETQT